MRTGLRRARRLGALTGSLALCLPLHLIWKALGLRSPWPRRFLALAARSVGARIRIDGSPRERDIFFIANHLSWIDILALGGTTGTAFISHDGVAGWPLVGWLARQNGTIFIARTDRHGVRDQIATLRAALEGHQPLALFPEGTTGDGTALLPFKPALLAGLMPPPRDLDIQPVWIDYGAAARDIAWHGEEPAGVNAMRLLGRKGSIPVTLHFLEPFDPEDYPDRKAVAEEARNRILARQAASLASSGTV
ncbi:MAG: lysophospholipid acyltransferase family protein [Sphingobium sp.]